MEIHLTFQLLIALAPTPQVLQATEEFPHPDLLQAVRNMV
jgi:hypothetical protein